MDRKPARWMCTLDERILEHLGNRSWETPGTISTVPKFNASKSRVEERCEMLAEAGLVAPLYEDTDMYEITSEGEQYLSGELDAGYLPRPKPAHG